MKGPRKIKGPISLKINALQSLQMCKSLIIVTIIIWNRSK